MAKLGQPSHQDDWELDILKENQELRARVAELEAIQQRARAARRGNAELTDDEEVGWLACARHIMQEPRRVSLDLAPEE